MVHALIARAEPDGTRAETRFLLSPKRTSPFKSVRASVQSTAVYKTYLMEDYRRQFSNRVSYSSTRSDTAEELTLPERDSSNCFEMQRSGMQVWRNLR